MISCVLIMCLLVCNEYDNPLLILFLILIDYDHNAIIKLTIQQNKL